MQLDTLWLTDFRSYPSAELQLAPGLTAVVGPNGQGKTNLLEALAWLATLRSFRGASSDALVRSGAAAAFVRAEGHHDARSVLIEAEITAGRHRVQVNRQRLRRARDLLGVLRVTVFTPDHLALIKEGPGARRTFLDEVLVALDPRLDAVVGDMERILRQRNALLRQCSGRLNEAAALTLDVWDAKLEVAGEQLASRRADLVAALAPRVAEAYGQLAGRAAPVELSYLAPWREEGLGPVLERGRSADVARGVTLQGPHRDELFVGLNGFGARTHASQGEQRCLALALELGAHRLVTEAAGSPPLLLLDDVFSELDPARCEALLAHLPPGQTLLTSAARLPEQSRPERIYRVEGGVLSEVSR